jgi:hypothetical protein
VLHLPGAWVERINSASNAVSAHVEGQQERKGSVSNASALSAQERIFVDVFVANGGKAGAALAQLAMRTPQQTSQPAVCCADPALRTT